MAERYATYDPAMPIVTLIIDVSRQPSREEAEGLIGEYMPTLFEMWENEVETFIAGRHFYFLAFQPGAYPPAEDGVIRHERSPFQQPNPGWQTLALAITTDAAARKSPFALLQVAPDPNDMPDGVSGSPRDTHTRIRMTIGDDDDPDQRVINSKPLPG